MDRVKCLTPWDEQGNRIYDAVNDTVCTTLRGGGKRGYPLSYVITVSAFMGGEGAKARSIAWCDDDTTPTLRGAPRGGNTVPNIVYSIEGNVVDRISRKNGKGWCENVSPTLNTQDRHAVAYDGHVITSKVNANNQMPGNWSDVKDDKNIHA